MPGITSKYLESINAVDSSAKPPSKMGAQTNGYSNGVSAKMEEEEEQMRLQREREDAEREERLEKEREKERQGGQEATDGKFKALEFLLSQSKAYASIMLSHMQMQEEEEEAKDERSRKRAAKREEEAEKAAEASQRKSIRAAAGAKSGQNANADERSLPVRGGRGKPKKGETNGKISSYFKKADLEAKAGSKSIQDALQDEAKSDGVKTGDIGIQNLQSARQPASVSGGTMRQYQLEGLEWLCSLYENGLNGILADEMGLGKTVQTISFLAFLREQQSFGPFLVVAPLSTTTNWVEEFNRWTPDIPVVLYHGSKQDREAIRRKELKYPGSEKFPVVVTSYEICMNDRKFLANFGWKFIIIDEGHRLKNLNCRLIRELQSYQSANRLLITGTPLQNNLTELWSLLHFLMPSIFDKLESFESWFDFSALKERQGYDQFLSAERQQKLVTSLHAILKPFLLRRVKADVESMMPRKREYVLFAPLTSMQRELYQAILDGTSRTYLEDQAVERLTASNLSRSGSRASLKRKALTPSERSTPIKSAKTSRESTPASIRSRSHRSVKRKDYDETNDEKYFAQLEANPTPSTSEPESEDEEEVVRAETLALAKRQIAQKKLSNPMMQLRLCCDSPYNFFNPFTVEAARTGCYEQPDETLVTSSGKMLLLDALLPDLFQKGHKVLIFSQFKTQLDLIEQYAVDLRGWEICRIDGSVPQVERQAQIHAFNRTGDNGINLFLLSTRAGGQGINLAAADTVVLFDSDWNPQQDLQAQDRAHRIGQTRNVIIYRFATRNTVEQTLLESAEGKRRLEKLVIRKGGLTRNGRGAVTKEQREEMDELQKLLRKSDGERFEVEKGLLSRRDLEILTDRSEEAYDRAEKGMDAGEAFKPVVGVGEGVLLKGLKT